METFKKELFFKLHNSHIGCRQLSDDQFFLLKEYLLKAGFGNVDSKSFFQMAKRYLENSKQFESLMSGIDLSNALQSLNLMSAGDVILIWEYPNDIDVVDLQYLITVWDDVWFGPSDDAVALFFPVFEQLILITHYNAIYY